MMSLDANASSAGGSRGCPSTAPLLPGERLLRVMRGNKPASTQASTPSLLLEGLRSFLREALPAEILEVAEAGPAAWSLKAVAFLDYIPVYVEARALPQEDGCQGVEVLGLRPTLLNDMLKFHQVMSLATFFLRSYGFKVLGPDGFPQARGPTELIDDFSSDGEFEDELVDGELVWAERLQALVADALTGRPAAVREEAAQALACLSETGSMFCHVALMRALLAKREELLQVFSLHGDTGGSAALAEAYPLAAALKCAALCPQAAGMLESSDLPARLVKLQNGQGLLARTIREVGEQASGTITQTGMCTPNIVPSSTFVTTAMEKQMCVKHDAQNSLSNFSTACSVSEGLLAEGARLSEGLDSEISTDWPTGACEEIALLTMGDVSEESGLESGRSSFGKT